MTRTPQRTTSSLIFPISNIPHPQHPNATENPNRNQCIQVIHVSIGKRHRIASHNHLVPARPLVDRPSTFVTLIMYCITHTHLHLHIYHARCNAISNTLGILSASRRIFSVLLPIKEYASITLHFPPNLNLDL